MCSMSWSLAPRAALGLLCKRPGYLIHERTLRAAKVGVTK